MAKCRWSSDIGGYISPSVDSSSSTIFRTIPVSSFALNPSSTESLSEIEQLLPRNFMRNALLINDERAQVHHCAGVTLHSGFGNGIKPASTATFDVLVDSFEEIEVLRIVYSERQTAAG